ncbi:phage tail-collar fiber domain-containing protein [Pectobacterium cacticida]|uniref:phage tail-collar fiber domain-containing protein n=1 Tax=Pectobacterium cacticida TaxID=69221 RepID=UPI003985C36B
MAKSVVTRAFEAWNVNKVLDGLPAVPDKMVFALIPQQDENASISRDEGMPATALIQHTADITQYGVLNDNAVVYSVVLDTSVGDWDYNWIGLVDSKTNTVLMIVHVRTQQKIKTKNGQQGNSLTRNLAMQFDGAADATQINVSAQTWQIDFSARLAGIDEMQRLITLDNFGNAAFLSAGFEVVRAGDKYTVRKGIGYVGGLRGELTQEQTLNGLRSTKIYADFSYQGSVVGQWQTAVKLTVASDLKNYADAVGFAHYVAPIASIDAAGNVTDLRVIGARYDRDIDDIKTRYAIKTDLSAWKYTAKGGELTLSPPYTLNACMIFINGIEQALNYSYSLEDNTITFAEALLNGDFVNVIFNVPLSTQGALTNDSETNALLYEIDKLRAEVRGLTGRDFLSADNGNIIAAGTDAGLFLPENALQKIKGIDVKTMDSE